MKPPSDPAGPSEAGAYEQDRHGSAAGADSPSADTVGPEGPQESSIVLATFASGPAAERTVARLGGGFRRKARHGHADAFVVTKNQQGSFSLVRSRVVTASGLIAAVMAVSASVAVGFTGLISALRGARSGTSAVQAHTGHAGASADEVRQLLDHAGEHGAGLVIWCPDDATAQAIEASAAKRAADHWHGSRSEFLAALDRRGSQYDWLRSTAGPPARHGQHLG